MYAIVPMKLPASVSRLIADGALGQPEIAQVDVLAAVIVGIGQQDVRRLHVPMHQAGGVREVQCLGHRRQDRQGALRIQRALLA